MPDTTVGAVDEAVLGRRTKVLAEVEAHRHATSLPDLEADLSINTWIDRVRGAAQEAHKMCRAGEPVLEYAAWLELVGAGVGRMEDLLRVLDGTEVRVLEEDTSA